MEEAWHTETVHLVTGHGPGQRSGEQSFQVKSLISVISTKSENDTRAKCGKELLETV